MWLPAELHCTAGKSVRGHGYGLFFSVMLCLSVGLCIPFVPDRCLINCMATAKRDKPCCSSLLITSVFNLRQMLNHGNQQFMQRSEITGFQKLTRIVTLLWITGNHSSAFHTSIIVKRFRFGKALLGIWGQKEKFF